MAEPPSHTAAARGIVVAGTHSGVGKTTLTLGLIAALRRRGLCVQPFKAGPDFIDPGHHAAIAGRPSYNLDGWMLGRTYCVAAFARHTRDADVAVVEGVMGLFDGVDGTSEVGSTAEMAKWLQLPVVLVVDASAMARSAAALVKGFGEFDPALRLAGVIFNRIGGAGHLRYLTDAMAGSGVRVLGGLVADQRLTVPERHLGLTTAQETRWAPEAVQHLVDVVQTGVDLDALLAMLRGAACENLGSSTHTHSRSVALAVGRIARIAVARDEAFCFYYPDNLQLLAAAGAELVSFSPLRDRALPPGTRAVYLGGGYPELFASQLSANRDMCAAIRNFVDADGLVYAECGGLMYLCETLVDLDGQAHEMAGIFPTQTRMLARGLTMGYREVRMHADALEHLSGGRDSLTARGHEFHYSQMDAPPPNCPPIYELTYPGAGYAGFRYRRCFGSYIHLHFGSNPDLARVLVAAACSDARS